MIIIAENSFGYLHRTRNTCCLQMIKEQILADIQDMLQIFGVSYPEQQGYCGYLVKFCWQACLVFWAPDWQRPALLLHSLTWAAGEMLLMFQMVRNWNQLFASSLKKNFFFNFFLLLGCFYSTWVPGGMLLKCWCFKWSEIEFNFYEREVNFLSHWSAPK